MPSISLFFLSRPFFNKFSNSGLCSGCQSLQEPKFDFDCGSNPTLHPDRIILNISEDQQDVKYGYVETSQKYKNRSDRVTQKPLADPRIYLNAV